MGSGFLPSWFFVDLLQNLTSPLGEQAFRQSHSYSPRIRDRSCCGSPDEAAPVHARDQAAQHYCLVVNGGMGGNRNREVGPGVQHLSLAAEAAGPNPCAIMQLL